MRKLYDVIRALRPQLRLPHEHLELQTALWHFERTNRGHAHELDRLATAAVGGSSPTPRVPGFEQRRADVRDTTQRVMDALRRPRQEWPTSSEFEALWSAHDSTGLIAQLTRESLRRLAFREAGSWRDYALHELGFARPREGGLELVATVGLRGTALVAVRTLRIAAADYDSLETSHALLCAAGQALGTLVAGLSDTPQFAPDKADQARRERLRGLIEQALLGLEPVELAWAERHWQELCPPALRRAAERTSG
jgi:hypothetical protein